MSSRATTPRCGALPLKVLTITRVALLNPAPLSSITCPALAAATCASAGMPDTGDTAAIEVRLVVPASA